MLSPVGLRHCHPLFWRISLFSGHSRTWQRVFVNGVTSLASHLLEQLNEFYGSERLLLLWLRQVALGMQSGGCGCLTQVEEVPPEAFHSPGGQ